MEVTVSRTDDQVVVTIEGEIDVSNRPQLSDALRTVAEGTESVVLVDVSGLRFMDSSGISELISVYRAVTERGSSFRIVNPTASFRRLLEITGLSEPFGLE